MTTESSISAAAASLMAAAAELEAAAAAAAARIIGTDTQSASTSISTSTSTSSSSESSSSSSSSTSTSTASDSSTSSSSSSSSASSPLSTASTSSSTSTSTSSSSASSTSSPSTSSSSSSTSASTSTSTSSSSSSSSSSTSSTTSGTTSGTTSSTTSTSASTSTSTSTRPHAAPPPESAELRTKRARDWCLCDLGAGELLHIDPETQQAKIQLVGWGGTCYAPASSLRKSINIHFRTFAKDATPSSFTHVTPINQTVQYLIDTIVKKYSQYSPEEIRLVHRGRELNRDHDPNLLLIECGLQHPYHILFVIDELSKFVLDSTKCGSDIIIHPDQISASIQVENKWYTVRGTASFTKGKHYWKLQCIKCSSGNMFIGVCDNDVRLSNYLGSDEHGWGYYGCGNIYRQGQSKPYGKSFTTGDVIGVYLDMDARTISYTRNEEALGQTPAFEDLPATVWPAFSLYSRGDQFTLTEFGTY